MAKTSLPASAVAVTRHVKPAVVAVHPGDPLSVEAIVGGSEDGAPLTLCSEMTIDAVFGDT